MRKSLVRAVFCREGGARSRVLPPDLRSPPSTTGGSLCGQLAFLKPLFVLKKETRWSPEAGGSPGLHHPPSPPSSSSFSSVLLVLFRILFGQFWVAVFLTRPGRFLTSTVNFLVREQGEHSATRGLGRPGERANSGLR